MNSSKKVTQARAENLAMGRPEWESVAGQATLGTIVGGSMGATVGGISDISGDASAN